MLYIVIILGKLQMLDIRIVDCAIFFLLGYPVILIASGGFYFVLCSAVVIVGLAPAESKNFGSVRYALVVAVVLNCDPVVPLQCYERSQIDLLGFRLRKKGGQQFGVHFQRGKRFYCRSRLVS